MNIFNLRDNSTLLSFFIVTTLIFTLNFNVVSAQGEQLEFGVTKSASIDCQGVSDTYSFTANGRLFIFFWLNQICVQTKHI